MKIAFVFPGQGSQSVGMLSSFASNPAVQEVLRRASAALGQDLARLIAEGPAEALNLTINTQPCMLVAGYAVFCAWRAAGGAMPAVMAGHSLGEYTALTAAGCFTLEDAVRLVRFRAQVMQEAVPVEAGAMAAILGLDEADVRAACAEAAQGEVVEAVNFNAPAQVVIAGHKAAVQRACQKAKERGAKRTVLLPVSAPFHSSLLAPASERLRERLAQVPIAPPCVPVIHNVDVATHEDLDAVRAALARQAAAPVRWTETIHRMAAEGVTHVVECGPGRVLAGLTKRINAALESLALSDATALHDVLEKLSGGQ
ncbi:MAG: ACP S-malonyltransferase [Sutterellaceae bacterium]|nr:ACP S-malonyltransferase [Burkholderiaceae bacterium]MCX7900953.1 ACP S-malonyltransferase [Burkholderiaceae bacterium]MDW8429822.1 ACP S-malonyltransferase [Sutterellaceae bacterium]